MDYFQPVTTLTFRERVEAYRIFENWFRRVSKISPKNGVKKISSSEGRQETLLKFIGMLWASGDQRVTLLHPDLFVMQRVMQRAEQRLRMSQIIKHRLKDVRGQKGCVGNLEQVTKQNLLSIMMLRGKLGGDSEFGSNFTASIFRVHDSNRQAPNPHVTVYNLAVKQMPMAAKGVTSVRTAFLRETAMNELKITRLCSNLAKKGICPNMPILYNSWECSSCIYYNPKLERTNVPKSCLLMANELATADLRTWMEEKHSLQHWSSCLFQVMAGLTAFHNVLGYVHKDLHWGNILYNQVEATGQWHYRMQVARGKYEDFWVPNTGQLWKLWDFGFSKKLRYPNSKKTRTKMACDVMRIIYLMTSNPGPGRRQYPMPDGPVRTVLLNMARAYLTEHCPTSNKPYAWKYSPAFDVIREMFRIKIPYEAVLNSEPYTIKAY